MTRTTKRILTGLLIALAAVMAFRLLLNLLPPATKIYDIGYVFYDYENDTDYIDPDAPYVNVGGRISLIGKEEMRDGAIENYCNALAYIDYTTGFAYTVCESKKCVHNNVHYTMNCPLAYFTSDLHVDAQGWIYGSYHPGVITTEHQATDTSRQPGVPELGRFNLYNQSYQTLYLYETDTSQPGYLTTDSIEHIMTGDRYVYFFEHLAPGWNGGRPTTFFRRCDRLSTHVDTLAEIEYPDGGMYLFGDELYTVEPDGLIRYDADYTPESRTVVASFSTDFFASTDRDIRTISDLQYDSYAQMIYFLRGNSDGSQTLCRVRAYSYAGDRGVVDRQCAEIPLDGSVTHYQLSYDRVYYTLAGRRRIGQITDYFGNRVPCYDQTDGVLYAFSYTECGRDAIPRHTVWDSGDRLIRSWTVIGAYLYGDLYGEASVERHPGYSETQFLPLYQVRIDLNTSAMSTLTVSNWSMAKQPSDSTDAP